MTLNEAFYDNTFRSVYMSLSTLFFCISQTKTISVENKYFMLRFVCYGSRDLSEHVIRPHVNKIDCVDEC